MKIKYFLPYFLISFSLFVNFDVFSQAYNNNPAITYINHDVPKSPESASFEKYGKIPVGEFTGTASVNVPLVSLNESDFKLPIDLSYHASGIKVSQEATWVGLGWDLIPGGRITLQIRGGYDKYSDQAHSQWNSKAKEMLGYLTSQVSLYPTHSSIVWGCGDYGYGDVAPPLAGQSPEHYSGFCNFWTEHPAGFSSLELSQYLNSCQNMNALEPDIYSVSVMGISFRFFKQLFTGKIVVLNENNRFKIEEVITGGTSYWIIIDDNGYKYIFQQEEKTYYRTYVQGLYPEITTSWLLSKIVLPNLEELSFTYANYGDEFAAPEIVESKITQTDGPAGFLGFQQITNRDNVNDFFYVKPQYLVKVESKKMEINFNLGYREDLLGLGARKLDNISVKDKLNNAVVKSVKFNYEYFASSTAHPLYLSESLFNISSNGTTFGAERLKKRLKLTSIDIGSENLDEILQTYRFIYNQKLLPNKVSTAQDHWGYYNDVNNINPNTNSISFTPTLSSLASEGIISTPYPQGTDTSLSGYANRSANEEACQAGILTTVIYPTGGYTNFEYELHSSFLNQRAQNLKGGGLRIKRISNFFEQNSISEIISYDYDLGNGNSSGIYLGNLDYLKANITKDFYDQNNDYGGYDQSYYGFRSAVVRTITSQGNLNSDVSNVSYSRVRTIFHNYKENQTYSTVKRFSIGNPRIEQVHYSRFSIKPFAENFLHLPPSPNNYLTGKLLEEIDLNHMGNVVKRIENFYNQHEILDSIYSIKIVNRQLLPTTNSKLPFSYFIFEPMKSYFTTLDSTITTTYSQSTDVVQRQTMEYNSYYQLKKKTSSSSNGILIEEFTTPLSYTTLPSAGYDGLILKNIVNVPIEKVVSRKVDNGLQKVVNAGYFKYDGNGNVVQSFESNLLQPIPLSQFQKLSFGNNGTVAADPSYERRQDALYFANSRLLKQLTEKDKSKSFLYDVNSEKLLAVAEQAKFGDIAFSSFEGDLTNGNWSIVGGLRNDLSFKTGNSSLNLNGGSILATVESGGKYLISYWSLGAALSLNVPAQTYTLSSFGDWTLYMHRVDLAANGQLSLTGNQTIDELRLIPNDAQITTFTHNSFGIESITDANGKTIYYKYDRLGRLKEIRDYKNDIIKSFTYNNRNNTTVNPTYLYFNVSKTLNFIKQCSTGQQGTVVAYNVPANKFMSLISQADADQKALDEIYANGQNYANVNGSCSAVPSRPMFTLDYSIPANGIFLITVYDEVSNHSEYYEVSGSGSLENIPGGYGYITINEINYYGQYSFNLDNASLTGVYVQFGPVTMNGNSNKYLYIQDF